MNDCVPFPHSFSLFAFHAHVPSIRQPTQRIDVRTPVLRVTFTCMFLNAVWTGASAGVPGGASIVGEMLIGREYDADAPVA